MRTCQRLLPSSFLSPLVERVCFRQTYTNSNIDKDSSAVEPMAPPNSVDVSIVGGERAVLIAALTSARQLHSGVLFDSHKYRNDGTDHRHIVLTGNIKLRATSDRQHERMSGYQTIYSQDKSVVTVTKTDTSFAATDKEGKAWMGQKLLLAA